MTKYISKFPQYIPSVLRCKDIRMDIVFVMSASHDVPQGYSLLSYFSLIARLEQGQVALQSTLPDHCSEVSGWQRNVLRDLTFSITSLIVR